MVNFAFFGSPDFSTPCLEGLVDFCKKNGHMLSFAACQPDKPAGRGKKIQEPAIKQCAKSHNLTVFQPASLRKGTESGDAFFTAFRKAQIDIAVVVAYGHLIPKRFLKIPQFGFINVHASLLPRWRGASPIQRAIAAGDHKTGVSIMDLSPKMDEGDVYLSEETTIHPEETTADLSLRLKKLGSKALLEALPGIINGSLKSKPQPKDGVTLAPKLSKEDGHINWKNQAVSIKNQCLAMQPWPGSYTFNGEVKIKLYEPKVAHLAAAETSKPGEVLKVDARLWVKTQKGVITFEEAQLEGKKRLPIKDFLNGYSLEAGDKLT